MSWEVDLWGRVRRQVESNTAGAAVDAADLANARLSSQATLATDYFQLRGADAQAQLLRDTVSAYQRALDITRNQYHAGTTSSADVVTAQAQLAKVGIQTAVPTYVPVAVGPVGSGDAPPRAPIRPGSVIAQTPYAGSRVYQNASVTLTVAE